MIGFYIFVFLSAKSIKLVGPPEHNQKETRMYQQLQICYFSGASDA